MSKTRTNHVTPKRLKAIRALMRQHGVAAFLVPSTDPHQSEYVPPVWERRKWLSGFTGSAGDLVVTGRAAGLWTDGRYYLQAEEELDGSGIRLFKTPEPDTPSQGAWLAKTLKKGESVGYDPRLLSIQARRELASESKNAGLKLKPIGKNLVDRVRDNQPPRGSEPVTVLPTSLTGERTAAKLKRVRQALKAAGAQSHVITTLDSIAWLFNIRGRDVDFNPVVIAYAVVTQKSAALYLQLDQVPAKARRALGQQVTLRDYDAIGKDLRDLAKTDQPVLLDPASCNTWIADRLKGACVLEKTSPIPAMKARKNATEVDGMRAAHVRDGVAMIEFLRWLEGAVPDGGVTELSAAEHLEELRGKGEHFQGLSFRTISGYAGHGAVIHYSVTQASDIPLHSRGIYLIDSGAQYLDGTTDITRTVLLGKVATKEEKDRFTRVLLGHIRLARAVFPSGVAGIRLDTLARTALWDAGLDYGHGTGHGVGAYLNVHEGPQSISVRGQAHIEAGNILSNEPGYYNVGAYGMRVENLVLVKEASVSTPRTPFFCFETITLCPIDTRLVEPSLLDDAERRWLNTYHETVYKTLHPLVPSATGQWLRQATRPI